MDWRLFASTFGLIFVAELPDKTALAALLMAARSDPRAVFVGAAAAFVIQSLVAVAFGSVFSLLPARIVHVGAGALFLVFAVLAWRERAEAEESGTRAAAPPTFWRVAASAFMVIFVAEWGDLTQLATATVAASRRAPVTIFAASTLALWAVTAIAVAFGRHAQKLIRPATLQRVAAGAFAAAGLVLLFS